jgi:hypothetical protein
MKSLRRPKGKQNAQIVTLHSKVEYAVIRACMQLANWREATAPPELAGLLLLYRSLAPSGPSRAGRSDEDDAASARELGSRLWQLLSEFERDPQAFRAAFRRLATNAAKFPRDMRAKDYAIELHRRRAAVDAVRTPSGYRFRRNGEVRYSYAVEFPTDESLFEFCRALLNDPHLDAGLVRRCLRESCRRFFLRDGKRIYCLDKCSEAADAARVADRVKAWRKREKEKREAARKHK